MEKEPFLNHNSSQKLEQSADWQRGASRSTKSELFNELAHKKLLRVHYPPFPAANKRNKS